jgi:hypothetical protein
MVPVAVIENSPGASSWMFCGDSQLHVGNPWLGPESLTPRTGTLCHRVCDLAARVARQAMPHDIPGHTVPGQCLTELDEMYSTRATALLQRAETHRKHSTDHRYRCNSLCHFNCFAARDRGAARVALTWRQSARGVGQGRVVLVAAGRSICGTARGSPRCCACPIPDPLRTRNCPFTGGSRGIRRRTTATKSWIAPRRRLIPSHRSNSSYAVRPLPPNQCHHHHCRGSSSGDPVDAAAKDIRLRVGVMLTRILVLPSLRLGLGRCQ